MIGMLWRSTLSLRVRPFLRVLWFSAAQSFAVYTGQVGHSDGSPALISFSWCFCLSRSLPSLRLSSEELAWTWRSQVLGNEKRKRMEWNLGFAQDLCKQTFNHHKNTRTYHVTPWTPYKCRPFFLGIKQHDLSNSQPQQLEQSQARLKPLFRSVEVSTRVFEKKSPPYWGKYLEMYLEISTW